VAARAYESDAYDSTVREAVTRTLKGGCFAVGILILLTQLTLTVQFAAKGMEVRPVRCCDVARHVFRMPSIS